MLSILFISYHILIKLRFLEFPILVISGTLLTRLKHPPTRNLREILKLNFYIFKFKIVLIFQNLFKFLNSGTILALGALDLHKDILINECLRCAYLMTN